MISSDVEPLSQLSGAPADRAGPRGRRPLDPRPPGAGPRPLKRLRTRSNASDDAEEDLGAREPRLIPPKTHPGWLQLLHEPRRRDFKFLAFKFLMARVQLQLRADDSPAAVERYVSELHSLASKYEHVMGPELEYLWSELAPPAASRAG